MRNSEFNVRHIIVIIGFFLLWPYLSSIFISEDEVVVPHINGMYDDEFSRRLHESTINHQRRQMGWDPIYQDY